MQPMSSRRIIIVGGGPAGVFAAITCAQACPDATVTVLEKGPRFLTKILVSGGGRCNVTHACFEARELTARYPRGARALMGPFKTFQPRDTVEWFEARGVKLKTEPDGRMFPVTDSSATISDCLLREARAAKVKLQANCGVTTVRRLPEGGFELTLNNQSKLVCDQLLLATGGCRSFALGNLAEALGHSLEAPAPSLFTFNIAITWLRDLAGIAVESAEVSVPDAKLREHGPVLMTHWGLSGPAILRLSAWGARALQERNYQFDLQVNWLPHMTEESIAAECQLRRQTQGARLVINGSIAPLPGRLWTQLVLASGINRNSQWAGLARPAQHQLIQQLTRTVLPVTGKSTNKDEFVTCGGVRLNEVNFKTMESRLCPGLHFAGELLDIDGITGGFNFQAAWTTGYIAGMAMSGKEG